MGRVTIDKSYRSLFGARFSDLFQKWKDEGNRIGEKRTQTGFGKLLCPPASRGSVSNWCKGEDIPSKDRLIQICKIFGVSEDHFDPENATHDELYKSSSNFIEGIGKKHVKFATLIDLDLDLIRALSHCVDFEKLFPLYSPIDHETYDPETEQKVYDREVSFSGSAPVEEVDDKLRFLQIERDGKRITLHRCDLAYLKEVQDQVVTFVEYLFYKRSEEMKSEVQKFNDDLIEETKEDGEIKKAYKSITPDYIRDHDRFAKYYYIFPNEPRPDWYSIYEEKPRKATQEDFDLFLNGAMTKGK